MRMGFGAPVTVVPPPRPAEAEAAVMRLRSVDAGLVSPGPAGNADLYAFPGGESFSATPARLTSP